MKTPVGREDNRQPSYQGEPWRQPCTLVELWLRRRSHFVDGQGLLLLLW